MLNETVSYYRIVGKIGEGGMGEVYRAQDTVLRRTVALKVLPVASQDDERRKRRFLREARSASALNHPGIITIHEVLDVGGTDVIVMEFVDGVPLSRLIPDPGLPLAQSSAFHRPHGARTDPCCPRLHGGG
ncbi:MAG: protein kinase [Thermoanaerobaculia bacterium]